jgi:hypothetical protein
VIVQSLQHVLLAASVAAVLTLPSLSGQPEPQNTPITTIPLRVASGNRLYLDARVNGSEPLSCILDSGGGGLSYLDQKKAAMLGIAATAQGRSAGPQSATLATDGRTRVTWNLPGLKLADVQLVLQNRPGAEYACNFGLGILSPYVVELDYDAAALRVYDPSKYHPSSTAMPVPMTVEKGWTSVLVTLAFPQGEPVQARLSIDTGGGGPAAYLTKSFIDRHGLMQRVSKTVPELRSGFTGDQPKVLATRLRSLSLGPVELSQPIVFLFQERAFGGSEPDGLLCPDFLRRFRLVFDFPRQTLLLERGAHFVSEMPFDASGTLIFHAGRDRCQVYKVVDGSPASEAGLRPNDTILEIDGKPASQFSNLDILTLLQQSGREVALQVQRGEDKQQLSLKLRRLL